MEKIIFKSATLEEIKKCPLQLMGIQRFTGVDARYVDSIEWENYENGKVKEIKIVFEPQE